MTMRVRLGGVAGTMVAQTAAITPTTTATTNVMWDAHVILTCRANGSAGTIMAVGDVTYANAATNGVAVYLSSNATGGTAPAAVTVDLTAAQNLSVTFQWSIANAGNTIQGHVYTLEALN